MKPKILMGTAMFVALTALSGPALAAFTGYIPTAMRLRAGPGMEYPVIARLPGNTNVFVNGCIAGWDWCEVEWNGLHGWTSGRFMQLMERNRPVATYSYAPTLGVPVVVFTRNDYWNRYYHDRPFYRSWQPKPEHHEGQWRNHGRDDDHDRDSGHGRGGHDDGHDDGHWDHH
jgi:uncharacterized protein YraI